jgi:hypothetical protein
MTVTSLIVRPACEISRIARAVAEKARGGGAVEKRYLTAKSLEDELRRFEEDYGLLTAQFVKAYSQGSVPATVPGFESFVWAATYRQLGRVRALGERQPA